MRLFDVRVFAMHLKKKNISIKYWILYIFYGQFLFFFSKMNKIFVLVSFFLVAYAYVNILQIAEGVQQSARQNSLYLQHEF